MFLKTSIYKVGLSNKISGNLYSVTILSHQGAQKARPPMGFEPAIFKVRKLIIYSTSAPFST